MEKLGIILAAVGIILTICSIAFAVIQYRKVDKLKTNELISLWTRLSRIHMLIIQIQKVIDSKEFQEHNTISLQGSHVIPQVFKGLCSEYVALVEAIVKKTPNISPNKLIQWIEIKKIRTRWELDQFIRLISVNEEISEKQISETLNAFDSLPDYGLNNSGTIPPENIIEKKLSPTRNKKT